MSCGVEECRDEYVIVPSRYYGYTSRNLPPRNPNPFDDVRDDRGKIHLCRCAREGCSNTEELAPQTVQTKPTMQERLLGKEPTIETILAPKSFPRCPVCMTKYCSKECQIEDWKSGSHKEKCRKFKIVKEHCEKVLCPKCWKSKWNSISDFYPGGKISTPVYKPCNKCYKKELMIEDSFSDEITSDPDISRVWFS